MTSGVAVELAALEAALSEGDDEHADRPAGAEVVQGVRLGAGIIAQ